MKCWNGYIKRGDEPKVSNFVGLLLEILRLFEYSDNYWDSNDQAWLFFKVQLRWLKKFFLYLIRFYAPVFSINGIPFLNKKN